MPGCAKLNNCLQLIWSWILQRNLDYFNFLELSCKISWLKDCDFSLNVTLKFSADFAVQQCLFCSSAFHLFRKNYGYGIQFTWTSRKWVLCDLPGRGAESGTINYLYSLLNQTPHQMTSASLQWSPWTQYLLKESKNESKCYWLNMLKNLNGEKLPLGL